MTSRGEGRSRAGWSGGGQRKANRDQPADLGEPLGMLRIARGQMCRPTASGWSGPRAGGPGGAGGSVLGRVTHA